MKEEKPSTIAIWNMRSNFWSNSLWSKFWGETRLCKMSLEICQYSCKISFSVKHPTSRSSRCLHPQVQKAGDQISISKIPGFCKSFCCLDRALCHRIKTVWCKKSNQRLRKFTKKLTYIKNGCDKAIFGLVIILNKFCCFR